MRRQQMHLAKSRDSEVWQETLGKRNHRDSTSADLFRREPQDRRETDLSRGDEPRLAVRDAPASPHDYPLLMANRSQIDFA